MPTDSLTELTVLAALMLWAPRAHALEWPNDETKILPCRPTIACTADIAAPGVFELETGAIYRRFQSPASEWTFPFLAKLTLVRSLQVQVGSNGYTSTIASPPANAEYFDNLNFVAKFHFADADPQGFVPSLAMSAILSVPTSSDQEGYVASYDALFVEHASKDIGPIHADLNAGLNLWRVNIKASPQEYVTLALSASLPAPFGVEAEAYYFSDDSPVASHDGGFLFAFTQSPRPWLTFDAGGDVGFFPSTRAFSTFVGMSIAPVVLWN